MTLTTKHYIDLLDERGEIAVKFEEEMFEILETIEYKTAVTLLPTGSYKITKIETGYSS